MSVTRNPRDPFDRCPQSCLSDLLLDRLLVGELVETSEKDAAQAHLEVCASCAQRYAELQVAVARFPKEVWVGGLARRAVTAAHARSWRDWVPLASAAAAVLVLAVGPLGFEPDGIRTKGGEELGLFVRRSNGRTEQALPGGSLSPGDSIRFVVSTERAAYIAVLGMDAAAAVTLYAPADGSVLWLPAGRRQLLPGSVVLDETLGSERLVALLCTEPPSAQRALEKARQELIHVGGDPRVVGVLEVGGCREVSFLIEKVARH